MASSSGAYRRYRRIAETLADKIRSGQFEPCARLPPERELKSEFGVSRPTVREAMIALELMGYVEVRGGSGVYVLGAEDARPEIDTGPGTFEILEARLMIEADIARIAARTISPGTIANMRQTVEELLSAFEKGHFPNEADQRFHIAIAKATGNSVLMSVVEQLWKFRLESNMWRVLEERANPNMMRSLAIEDHIAILRALEDGDADEAHDAMQRHMQHNIEMMLDGEVDAPAVSEQDQRSKLRLLLSHR